MMPNQKTMRTQCSGFVQESWRKANRCKRLETDILSTPLKRCLHWGDLIFLGLGHMLGAAVYVMTGVSMKEVAGPAIIISYVIAGIVSMINGMCYAQFSVNIPKAGTAYNYVYTISGELWGFLAGWNLILENLISAASVSRGMSAYINAITGDAISNATISWFGRVDSEVFGEPDFLAGALCITAFIIIAVGVRASANAAILTTGLNIIVLIIIAIAGYSVGSIDTIAKAPGGFFPFGVGGMLTATGTAMYAYIGFDAVAVASEETRDPNKSLPRAMVLCVLSACLLYCAVTFSLMLIVPYDQIDTEIPFPAALMRYGLSWTARIVIVGAMFGMVSSLIGQTFCLTRMTYAMACDGLLFSQLKYVNSWTQTPLISILISALMAAILTIVTRLKDLVEMVSGGTLFAMSLMIISLLKLHYLREKDCPFELLRQGQELSDKDPMEENEKSPILPRNNNHQQLDKIGSMKYFEAKFGDTNLDRLNTLIIGALSLSLLVLSVVVTRTLEYITTATWWTIFFLALSVIGTAISFSFLSLFEPNKSFTKYSVPLIPLLPAVGLFGNFCLLMCLNKITWVRLIVWIVIGLLIYGLYGVHHSIAYQQEMGIELIRRETDADQTPTNEEDDNGILDSNAQTQIGAPPDYFEQRQSIN